MSQLTLKIPQNLQKFNKYLKCFKSSYIQQSRKEYIPIYNFPYIRPLAFMHKAKVYQTVATIIGIPASFALSMADVCSTEVCSAIAACGITGSILFHTFGYLTANTVGIIYLHNDEQKSKVSYLDAWGSRRDVEIPLKNIVPFCDQPHAITDPLYLQLEQYTTKDKFKLNVKYGVVLDPKRFELIFYKKPV